jgi:hypothetical protein
MNRPRTYTEFAERLKKGDKFYKIEKPKEVFQLIENGNTNTFQFSMNGVVFSNCICFIMAHYVHKVETSTLSGDFPYCESRDLYFVEIAFKDS